MIFKFVNLLENDVLNLKNWTERNNILFLRKVFFTFILFLPTVLFFSNSRIVIFLSFILVIFIINLVFFKFVYQSQNSHLIYNYDTLKNSFDSILYINRKIRENSFINSENWRFDKLARYFLWQIKYSLMVNNRSLKFNLINLF